MEIFKRHFLKEKEAKQLLLEIKKQIKINTQKIVGANIRIEFAESKIATIFLINNKPLFAKKDDCIFPTLGFDDITRFLPQIVVNMGAVPYVCNGADVMAPGVVAIKGNFKKDDFIIIVDEQNQKTLAIGVALYDVEVMKNMKNGKLVKNIHFVGDKFWHLLKKLSAP